MKLTLAMGLQYDNGKKSGMLALSLAQANQASAGMQQHGMVESGLAQALNIQPQLLQPALIQGDQMVLEQTLPIRIEKMKAPLFLTYNLKGLSDTLVFDGHLLDVFV